MPGTPFTVPPPPMAHTLPVPEADDEEMQLADDPLDPRNLQVGAVGSHPVNPQHPFDALPQNLHAHAQHLISQGHSAEGACRQLYDNWMDSLLRDWGQEFDGVDPDRELRGEDWVRMDPHDAPTQYMHNAVRQSDYMEDLVNQTWQAMGKPYYFSEESVAKMLHHALGQGQHEEVYQLHREMHPSKRLNSVHDLIEPYMRHLMSGGRAYDLFGDMPPIQHYQLPPELQAQNLAHFHQISNEIIKHLRDRNYSNADIQQKLDEMHIDLGGLQQHGRGSRWS